MSIKALFERVSVAWLRELSYYLTGPGLKPGMGAPNCLCLGCVASCRMRGSVIPGGKEELCEE